MYHLKLRGNYNFMPSVTSMKFTLCHVSDMYYVSTSLNRTSQLSLQGPATYSMDFMKFNTD